jgi:hypothetical protein
MRKIDKPGRQIIHARKIDISIYEGDSDSIILEGILRDERLLDSYLISGKMYPSGTLHHMIIRMEVRGPKLVIEDIEVEMPTIPHNVCAETIESLKLVKGLAIVSGFTSKVRKLVGGTKGCNHLALLTAMAPAAVQGAWSAMVREPVDSEGYMPAAIKRVRNTCWIWREDGPLVKEWSAES